MKNKNKNIDKFFSEKLPDPEIPADDAWGKMNDMLNATPAVGKAGHIFKGSAFKLLSGLILVGIVSVGVVLFLNNDKKDVANKSEKPIKETVSAAEKSNVGIAKVGEIEKSEKSEKSEKGVENETVAGAGPDKGVEKDKSTNTDLETRKDPEIEKGGTKAKYPGRSNLVTSAPDNNSKSAKPTLKPKRNVSKSAVRKNVAGERDEQFGVQAQNQKSARESSSDRGVAADRNKRPEAAALSLLKSLRFKPHSYDPRFSAKIRTVTQSDSKIARSIAKESNEDSFEVGLEWSLISPLKKTDLLFTSIDSTRKPALLLIPGVYVSKSFRKNHSLTLSASAYQPYFGNNGKLAQDPDSVSVPDSSLVLLRTTLLKTAGVNLALQYQYEFVNHLKIGAGVAYSRIFGALVQEQLFNDRGEPLHPVLVTLRGSEQIGRYLNKDIFYFKAGLLYEIGRFQTGINILAPLNNFSASPKYPVRQVNGQLFLRFRVW